MPAILPAAARPELPAQALLALQETAQEGGPSMLVMLGGLALIFWFVLIGPERKEKKRKAKMLEELKKNDKVLLSSGIYATVAAVNEGDLTLRFDDSGTRVRVLKSAVASVIEPDGAADKA